jgi:acyl-CoA reductase-like NAD-dependent aldehyde dehydrogenase
MAITLQSHRTLQECKHQELEPLSEDDRSWKKYYWGQSDEESCYIAPTLIDETSLDSLIMKDEIFGPLLPILYGSEADIHVITNMKNRCPYTFY